MPGDDCVQIGDAADRFPKGRIARAGSDIYGLIRRARVLVRDAERVLHRAIAQRVVCAKDDEVISNNCFINIPFRPRSVLEFSVACTACIACLWLKSQSQYRRIRSANAHGAMCTNASALRGVCPQAASMRAVSREIQPATEASTQSGNGVPSADTPPVELSDELGVIC